MRDPMVSGCKGSCGYSVVSSSTSLVGCLMVIVWSGSLKVLMALGSEILTSDIDFADVMMLMRLANLNAGMIQDI